VLKGIFVAGLNQQEDSAVFRDFQQRRRQLPPTAGEGELCSSETDDDGNLLWAADHDHNESTPLLCAGDDPETQGSYDALGYDAVFAIAHALHDLIEVQNVTEIVGSELLESLITRVRFEGVSGTIGFYDAKADPSRLYHGDRRVGVSYTLYNWQTLPQPAGAQGLVAVGTWSPCKNDPCDWLSRWRRGSGVELIYSTPDNSLPPQARLPTVVAVRLGVLLPSALFGSPRVGVVQAIRELNDKDDSVADELLPNTKLLFAIKDSACDASVSLAAASFLTGNAFHGEGVSAIIGADCSGASVTAAQVAGGTRVPIISGSSTSPVLSDGIAFPYFLRTIPSDAFGAAAMVDLLLGLWNYTSAALVHSTDAYGSGAADAFAQTASASGLTVRTTQSFRQNSASFFHPIQALLQGGGRVIVLICQANDGARFLREAFGQGLGGEGYFWLGGDALAGSGLWESDLTLSSDIVLRHRVFKGFFALAPDGQQVNSTMYQGYFARRRQLSPIISEGELCSSETDDDGNLLWAADHDHNESTSVQCTGIELSRDGLYDTYGYDAVFAIAHALHDLIEVQNVTEIVGSELLESLITRVRFEGVTGTIGFYDASDDQFRLYHGDRRRGVSYTLYNWQPLPQRRRLAASGGQGFVAVGRWTPGGSTGQSGWSDRWQSAPGVVLAYSSADNSPPLQVTRVDCPAGMVTNRNGTTGSLQCVCELGFGFSGADVGRQCIACPHGAYKGSAGNDACTPCPPGTHQPSTGSSGCNLCQGGYYTPYSGSIDCLRCASPVSSYAGSAACNACEEATYQATAEPPSSRNCLPCPASFECGLNTSLASVYIRPGFWRLSPKAAKAYHCDGASDDSPCGGGSEAGVQGSGYCASNYSRGPLCEVCSGTVSMHYDSRKRRCVNCPDEGAAKTAFLGLLLGLLCAVAVLMSLAKKLFDSHSLSFWAALRASPRIPEYVRPAVDVAAKVARLVHYAAGQAISAGAGPTLKILLTFGQLVALIPRVYGIELPPAYKQVWGVMTTMADVNIMGLLPCEGFFNELLWLGFSPIVLAAILFVIGTCMRKLKFGSEKERSLPLRDCALLGGLPPTVLIVYVWIPVMSSRLFSAFNCIAYEYDTVNQVSMHFMRDAPGVQCYTTDEHDRIVVLALVLMGIWPIGATILCTVLLVSCRKAISDKHPTVLSNACAFLHREFEPQVMQHITRTHRDHTNPTHAHM
jgi:hypothetical protein